MKFSDYHKIKRSKKDDWFDPILSVDTPLFIDPFLIYKQGSSVFQGSHAEIIRFFNEQFKLIAQAKGDRSSVLYHKAMTSLVFPEVSELCLGYTTQGTRGAGSSIAIAATVAGAIWEAVQAGMTKIRHFEEIALLREGFGADRISDMTAGILRYRLARYTSSVCARHGVPLRKYPYRRGRYNASRRSWEPLEGDLPFNRWNGRPVLLVPQKYLRELPTINADNFWDYCFTNENDLLRTEFSEDVARHVDKPSIIALARRHPDLRAEYITHTEEEPTTSYDVSRDIRGYLRWYDASAGYCFAHPLSLVIRTQSAFLSSVDQMVNAYRHFVEENQGWRLLLSPGMQ